MTNTHITIGGHKVTTYKSGVQHIVTSFLNGYTGTLLWQVTNGICTVTLNDFGRSSGDGRIVAYTGLPKCKMDVVYQQMGVYGNISVHGTTLDLYQGSGGLTRIWQSINYPVADDWVES